MSSTTSKRLKRIWGIIDSAYETGAVMVSVAFLEAALDGGEKWARLEAIAAQAPLPPAEYRASYFETVELAAEGHATAVVPEVTPAGYEVWYDQEMDRLDHETEKVLAS